MPAPRGHAGAAITGGLDEVVAQAVEAGAPHDADAEPPGSDEAETLSDERLASIATETSIYEQPRWGS